MRRCHTRAASATSALRWTGYLLLIAALIPAIGTGGYCLAAVLERALLVAPFRRRDDGGAMLGAGSTARSLARIESGIIEVLSISRVLLYSAL